MNNHDIDTTKQWMRATDYDPEADLVPQLEAILRDTELRWFTETIVQPHAEGRLKDELHTWGGDPRHQVLSEVDDGITPEMVASAVLGCAMKPPRLAALLMDRFGVTETQARNILVRNPISWNVVYGRWAEYLIREDPDASGATLSRRMAEFLPPVPPHNWYRWKRILRDKGTLTSRGVAA